MNSKWQPLFLVAFLLAGGFLFSARVCADAPLPLPPPEIGMVPFDIVVTKDFSDDHLLWPDLPAILGAEAQVQAYQQLDEYIADVEAQTGMAVAEIIMIIHDVDTGWEQRDSIWLGISSYFYHWGRCRLSGVLILE